MSAQRVSVVDLGLDLGRADIERFFCRDLAGVLDFLFDHLVLLNGSTAVRTEQRNVLLFEVLDKVVVAVLVELVVVEARQLDKVLIEAHCLVAEGALAELRPVQFVNDGAAQSVHDALLADGPVGGLQLFVAAANRHLADHLQVTVVGELLATARVILEVVELFRLVRDIVEAPDLLLDLAFINLVFAPA